MTRIDFELAAVAARQHGLVTYTDVLAAGGDRRLVHRRNAAGRWVRVEHGVYRLAGTPVTWHQKVLAAVLAAGPGAVASHHSAAVLLGIPGFGPGMPEITIPRGSTYRRTDVRVHESTDLHRCATQVRDRIVVTGPGRTLLDLARRTPDRRMMQLVEGARRQRLVTWSDLAQTLAIHARRGRPGIRRLRRVVVAGAHREEISDSDFELLVLAALVDGGLPEPVLHHRVLVRGEVFELDLAYPELRIAIELDGAVHLDAAVRERDLPRQNAIVLAGWTVLRFTWAAFRDRPDAMVAEVRAAIRAARQRLAAG